MCEFGETERYLFDRDVIERAFTPDVKPLFPDGYFDSKW